LRGGEEKKRERWIGKKKSGDRGDEKERGQHVFTL
jgi:hypothetical protein